MIICHFTANNKRHQVVLYFEFSYFTSGKMPKKSGKFNLGSKEYMLYIFKLKLNCLNYIKVIKSNYY